MLDFKVDKKIKSIAKEVGYSNCLICKRIICKDDMYNSRVCSEDCWDWYIERGE